MNITKEEIEQFKKDCKAKNLRLPNPCTNEWCIAQIKEIHKDIEENNIWAFILGYKDTFEVKHNDYAICDLFEPEIKQIQQLLQKETTDGSEVLND